MAESPLHVAVAIIRDAQGRVLLSRRQAGTHLAGLWEFPGGKLESGESIDDALSREILEELGVEILQHRPLIQILHHYPEKTVLLDVHLVQDWRGEPSGVEGQQIEWVPLHALQNYPMPEADVPIVRAMELPDYYLITPSEYSSVTQFLSAMEVALESGIRLMQLRLPGCEERELQDVAVRALALCHRYDAKLMVKSRALAEKLECGLHLTARELLSMAERPLLSEESFVAASCHDSIELSQAQKLGLDFVTLSPVLPTTSHPGATSIGWQDFSKLAEKANIPVYALGGMSKDDLAKAWQSGGQGIAAIRGLWPEAY